MWCFYCSFVQKVLKVLWCKSCYVTLLVCVQTLENGVKMCAAFWYHFIVSGNKGPHIIAALITHHTPALTRNFLQMRSQETVSHLEQQIEGEWGALRVTSCLCFLTCYPWIWQCWKLESKWAAVCFSFRPCSDHMQQLSLHRALCVLSAVQRAFTFVWF